MSDEPAPRPSRSLFRPEAIEAQREKLLGELSTVRPVPMWIFTGLAVSFATAFLVFAFVGEYTRRERVEGFLAGDAGAARILAPAAGTITQILVKEGDEVQAGSEIARLKTEHGSTWEDVEQQLLARKHGLQNEQTEAELMGQQQRAQLNDRIKGLTQELEQAGHEVALQDLRIASAQEALARAEDLNKRGFLSDDTVRARRNELLDQQSKLQSLKRAQTITDRDLHSAQADLPQIDLRTRNQIQQIEQKKGELEQDLLQNRAKQEQGILASISGVVTNIVPNQGESVAANTVVATILPNGTHLHAQLLVPTRAIGFIVPGNGVVLRYDAFPFQRFGQYHGTVASVSRTVWTPGEKIGPLTVREPVYRVDVTLDKQTASNGGQEFPLRPGMMVSADILLEKRTLFEWIFEPVLALRQRMQ
jgi:membrane fusion protein